MATSADSLSSPYKQALGPCVGRGLTTHENMEGADVLCGDTLPLKIKRHLFNRFHILRSSAFRLGFMFWLLFTMSFGLGLFAFYQTLEERVLKRIDGSITDRLVDVQKVYELNGLEAVIELAESKSESPMTSSMGFHLSTIEGDRIAGNVPICITQPGWDVLVAFAIAFLFTQRAERRVNGISSALDKVAAGNLVARLPVTTAGDDIDILSTQINSSLDRLRVTVDSMRQVSTDIAHDLKTPLNRLYITIEEASTKSRTGQCVGDDLEGALEEAQGINGTFEALLRIAQIEAGAKKSQFKTLNLKEVLETAAEVYTPVVEENEQRLTVDVANGADGQSLPLFGDRNLMIQLVVNLIENSVNHCKAGTNIAITGGEDSAGVWMRVADSGPGIPDSEREKVFQRLYRLERSRTTRGTGLGLSLVKAIADLHRGAIELGDNKPGLATTIRFSKELPAE